MIGIARLTWRARRILVAMCCGGALMALAPTGAAGPRRGDAVDAFLDAPDGSQLIVSVDDARELADGAMGMAGLAVLDHFAPDLPKAWMGLAKQLGMSDREAFDKLFGTRVLIATAPNTDRTWSWVVRCLVEDGTADTLRRSIVQAPRKLVNGRQVLAAEGGRFELIVVDLPGKRSEVLLGPAANPKLLDAAALQRPRPDGVMMRPDPRERHIELLPRGARIFVYSELSDRWLPGLGDLGDQCESWTALAATPQDDGLFKFTFVTMLENRPERVLNVRKWSHETFEAFAHGAVVAIIESDALSRELWPTIEQRFLGAMGDRVKAPDHAQFGGRIAFGLFPSPTGPLDVVVGAESPRVSALAVSGDTFMSGLVGLMPGLGDAGAHDLGGMSPDALREVDLRPAFGNVAVMGWPDVGPTLAWRYPRTPEGGDQGWMMVGIGADLVDQAADALVAPTDEAMQSWLSLGVVRPADLAKAVTEFPWPWPGWFDEIKRVESLSWQVMAGPGGALIGTGEVRLAVHEGCCGGQ